MTGAMGRPRWSHPDLAGASTEVVAAARWELYVHRIWPAAYAADLAGPDEPPKAATLRARRRQGRLELAALRKSLFPPDEESD